MAGKPRAPSPPTTTFVVVLCFVVSSGTSEFGLFFFLRVSWSQLAICGGPLWRSLVHGFGLDISVEIEVRFRESFF